MLFVIAFSVLSEIVTKEPAFECRIWWRIALIITIRIARTLQIRFSLFLSLFRQFSTPPQLYQSRKNPSSAPLAAAVSQSPPVKQRPLEESRLQLLRRASPGVSTFVSSCFSYFFDTYLLIDVVTFSFEIYFPSFRLYSLTFIEHSWVVSFENSSNRASFSTP